jgi:hypothetical protein
MIPADFLNLAKFPGGKIPAKPKMLFGIKFGISRYKSGKSPPMHWQNFITRLALWEKLSRHEFWDMEVLKPPNLKTLFGGKSANLPGTNHRCGGRAYAIIKDRG